MAIADSIQNLKERISAAYDACETKGAVIPEEKTTWNLSSCIESIPAGSASKYGMTIDDTIGDVDENGNLLDTPQFGFNGEGIKKVGDYQLQYKFHSSSLSSVAMDDLETVGQYGMAYFANNCSNLKTISFNKLKSVGDYGFQYAFNNSISSTDDLCICFPELSSIGSRGFTYSFQALSCNSLTVSFPKVTGIGENGFYSAFGNVTTKTNLTKIDFPELSVIKGNLVFGNVKAEISWEFPKVVRVEGNTGSSGGQFYGNNWSVMKFPSLSSITGRYVFGSAGSYPRELHFASRYQTQITSSEYYSTLWGLGAGKATVYFDL